MKENGMESEQNNLVLEVNQISSRAFLLAQTAFQRGHGLPDLMKQAQQLNDQLDEFWPQIQASAADLQPELSRAWSDARLDVGFVLSHGDLSTSTRLFHYIQDHKRG